MIYYFAYGSNMDNTQIKDRCPNFELLGKANLENHRLDFTHFSKDKNTGTADIIRNSGDKVYGLLYRLTELDLKKLDENECPAYKRFIIKVIDEFGMEMEAETYEVVNKEKEFQKPSKKYMDKLINAAKKFKFPTDYQDFLNNIEIQK